MSREWLECDRYRMVHQVSLGRYISTEAITDWHTRGSRWSGDGDNRHDYAETSPELKIIKFHAVGKLRGTY